MTSVWASAAASRRRIGPCGAALAPDGNGIGSGGLKPAAWASGTSCGGRGVPGVAVGTVTAAWPPYMTFNGWTGLSKASSSIRGRLMPGPALVRRPRTAPRPSKRVVFACSSKLPLSLSAKLNST